MSLITCLSWVPKGYAIPNPMPEKITTEDLAEIKEGEDIDMNLDHYDKEEAIPEFSNIEYDPQLENYKDEEEEDNLISSNDCVLVAGVQNGDFSELHIYIYVQETSSLYIHHDLILPAYPLSLQWLPFNPVVPNTVGNCLAVGSFLPEIEIWNLDVLEVLEPVARLGGVKRVEAKSGKKRKKTVIFNQKTYAKGSHHDAVITLHLHPTRNNILASGSADKKVKLWDVLEAKCKSTFEYHEDKIQCVRWNPTEEKILASGGLGGFIHLKSADSPNSSLSTSVPASLEALEWNPFNPNQFCVTTEDGFLYSFDARNLSTPVFEIKAHEKASCFAFSPGFQGMLATASKDKTVKVWDLASMSVLAERNAGVDQLYCIEFYKDAPFVLATGGMGGELAIWDTEENENVRNKWG